MKRTSIYIVILSMIFNGCSSTTSLYNSDYTLTNNQTESTTTDLRINIPEGWFTSKANEEKFIDLWLIKDDYSASIMFLPIHFDVQNLSDDNSTLKTIYDLVKVKAQSEGNTNFTQKQTDVFFGNSILAFEFINTNHERCRTTIFQYKDQYFQCTAVMPYSQITPEDLFTIQNSVLKSVFDSK